MSMGPMTLKTDIFVGPDAPSDDVLCVVQTQLILEHLISLAVNYIHLRTFRVVHGAKLTIPNG